MGQFSIRLPDTEVEQLDREAEELGTTRAELVRDVLGSRNEPSASQEELDELRAELDRQEQKIARLQNEKQMILSQRDENRELVEYVEEHRSIERQRADREQQRRSANIFRRTIWKITGEPDLDGAES